MRYFSTRNKNKLVSFKEAVMEGLASDGGLFMPEEIPSFPNSFIENLESISFEEIGFETAKKFAGDEISDEKLREIISKSLFFPAPVVELDESIGILELFHGPTLAFKDFGAQFMARTMGYFVQGSEKELNILVATSGDTGSAVANGFYEVEGINVFILYPSGKVSAIQEKQLTTLGKNITALEIQGTFDDCQDLVKKAFVDRALNEKLNLSSANSINIARLIPQSFYYINAFKQVAKKNKKVVVSVPSGNLGNITAGLMAHKMGLPVDMFIAATNSNDVFTNYLSSGKYEPRKSVQTYSNAMDVGNPSNFERIQNIYGVVEAMNKEIFSVSHNDESTVDGIKEVFEKYNYIIDPHGSVGYLALKKFLSNHDKKEYFGIGVETAHPAKFKDIIESTLGKEIEIPERLKECINREKKSSVLDNKFDTLKNFLLSL